MTPNPDPQPTAKQLFFVGIVQTAIVLWAAIDLFFHQNASGLLLLLVAIRNGKITWDNWDVWHDLEAVNEPIES